MKYLTITICILAIVCKTFAQAPVNWNRDMLLPDAKYKDIVERVNLYFEEMKNHNIEYEIEEGEDLSIEQYSRWANYWLDRVSDGTVTNAGKFSILPNSILSNLNTSTCVNSNYSNWKNIGPIFNSAHQGIIVSACLDPDDSKTLYVGTKAGGIWKTTNADQTDPTWTNLQDINGNPAAGVSSIIVLPEINQVKRIFIATGARLFYGLGVYQSTDNGQTWDALACNTATGTDPIVKILVEPGPNPSFIYVMSDQHIYKVDFVNNSSTLIYNYNHQLCHWWSFLEDFCFDPNDPNILYVSSDGDLNCPNTRAALKKMDLTGNTFNPTDITPNANLSSIRLSTCSIPTGNHNIYTFSIANSTNDFILQVYNGSSWGTPNSQNISGFKPFPDDFKVSPIDPTVMYASGSVLYKKTSSTSWTQSSNYSTDAVHGDVRCIVFQSATTGGNSDQLFIGTDGGLSWTSTGGGTNSGDWISKNGTGMILTEFYGLAITEGDKNLITGGGQDNHQYIYQNGSWLNGYSGDGYRTVIYPSTTSSANYNLYGLAAPGSGSTDWTIDRSICGAITPTNSWSSRNSPSEPSREDRPFKEFNNQLYIGHVNLWKASPSGLLSWTQASNITVPNVDFGMRAFSIMLKPNDNTKTIGYFVYKNEDWSSNNGSSRIIYRNLTDITTVNQWTDISNNIVINSNHILDGTGLTVSDILMNPNDPNIVWITLGGFSNNRVLKSMDGGSNWSDFSSGLPTCPVNCIAYQTGSYDALYVGTDRGVFYRDGTMNNWICYSQNLPNCQVRDIKINYCYQKLRIATFGRGIWESDMYPSPFRISTSQTWTGGDINTDIVVDNGATLTINSQVSIGRGRKITVESGGMLIVAGGHLFNRCGEMWDGIYGKSNSKVVIENSTVEHAFHACNFTLTSDFILKDDDFINNFISVYVPDENISHTILGTIEECNFTSTQDLPHYFDYSVSPSPTKNRPLAGIEINDVTYLQIGSLISTTNNEFSNMENGVIAWRSNVVMEGNSFTNIRNTGLYFNSFDGSCIYANGSGSSSSIKVIGRGTSANLTNPEISECDMGVNIESERFRISTLWIDKTISGIRIAKCSEKYTCYINANEINCEEGCVLLDMNDNTKNIIVIENVINVAQSAPISNPGAFGILILEYHAGTKPYTHISLLSNVINVWYGFYGINAVSTDGITANNNEINLFRDNTNPFYPTDFVYGIYLGDCHAGFFSRNTITGINVDQTSLQIGIQVSENLSDKITFLCNQVGTTFNNIRIGGFTANTDFLGTQIGSAYEGLHVMNNGIIGQQIHNGNCFNGTYTNSNAWGAVNNNFNLPDVVSSQFQVNDNNGVCYFPLNNVTSLTYPFFLQDYASDEYTCPEGGGGVGGEQMAVYADDYSQKQIDMDIAENRIGTLEYSEQAQWESKKYLFGKIENNPDLLQNSTLNDFYNLIKYTNIDKINSIGIDINSLFDHDPLITLQYLDNLHNIELLMDTIYSIDSLEKATNISMPSNHLHRSAAVNMIEQLEANNDIILQYFKTEKEDNAEDILSKNNSLVASETIENNIKAVNDIYLNTIAKGRYQFTESEITILIDIAQQCPYEGGPGVYRARSLYYTINPTYQYSDELTCVPLGYFKLRSPEEKLTDCISYPTPTSNIITIECDNLENLSNFRLFNSDHRIVLDRKLEPQSTKVVVDISSLQNGVYTYVINNEKNVGTGKFIVIK